MPSGYTAKMYEGEDQSFDDFVMSCARGMGALITMRDEPMDAPIPDAFEPSDYHAKAIEDAEWRLRNLDTVSDESARLQADQEYQQAHAAWMESRRKEAELRERYVAMLAKVQAWEPPTPDHVHFKEFMVEQLTGSIDFDCPSDWPTWRPEPQPKSIEEWKSEKRAKAERDLTYHSEEHAKEIARARERTEWVTALRLSLLAQSVIDERP